MPRAHRLRVEGGIFHLTHRCHNRAFLLKFARDRDRYRAGMREALQQFDMSLLDYCLTCNHVHLLVEAQDRLEVSAFMRKVAGEFALDYNKRKERLNACGVAFKISLFGAIKISHGRLGGGLAQTSA